jgi:hypothetical protein
MISVPVLFIIACGTMFYLFNWSLKKSMIISGGAAVAMVIADSIALRRSEKKTHYDNTLNSDSTNPNTA